MIFFLTPHIALKRDYASRYESWRMDAVGEAAGGRRDAAAAVGWVLVEVAGELEDQVRLRSTGTLAARGRVDHWYPSAHGDGCVRTLPSCGRACVRGEGIKHHRGRREGMSWIPVSPLLALHPYRLTGVGWTWKLEDGAKLWGEAGRK